MNARFHRRSTTVAALSLCVLVSAAACARAEPHEVSASAPAAVAAPPAAASAAGPAPASEPVMPGGRMVMSEVALSLRAASPARAAEAATAVAARAGGYVSSRDSTTADDVVVHVEMVLRVPAEKLEPTLSELRRQGHVLDESVSGKDVTEEYSDARAELSAKRKLEERLLAIVASAKSVKEMLEVEGELTRVRGEIEKLEGRTRYLENRAAFATIRLSLASPSQPAAPVAESVGSRLRNAVSESCTLFLNVTTGLIVAFGAVSPFLVPAALAALYIRRRRRMQKALLAA